MSSGTGPSSRVLSNPDFSISGCGADPGLILGFCPDHINTFPSTHVYLLSNVVLYILHLSLATLVTNMDLFLCFIVWLHVLGLWTVTSSARLEEPGSFLQWWYFLNSCGLGCHITCQALTSHTMAFYLPGMTLTPIFWIKASTIYHGLSMKFSKGSFKFSF